MSFKYPARRGSKHYGNEHASPPDLGDDPCQPAALACPEEYENGEALGVHLRLAPPVCGDDLPPPRGDHPEPRHGELRITMIAAIHAAIGALPKRRIGETMRALSAMESISLPKPVTSLLRRAIIPSK